MAAGGSVKTVSGIWTVSPQLLSRLPRKRRKRKKRRVRRKKKRSKSISLKCFHVCCDAFSLVLSLQKLYHRIAKCDLTLHIFSESLGCDNERPR